MRFMTTHTWIVIANEAKMRILASNGKTLHEVNSHVNPDTQPRGPHRNIEGTPHSMDDAVSVNEHEAETFAKSIGKQLELERTKNTFAKLYLIAPPSFMGLLRKNLSKPLAALVAGEIKKDLIQSKPDEVRTYLPDVI